MAGLVWPTFFNRAGLHIKQALRSLNRRRLRRRRAGKRADYADWAARHDSLGDAEQAALRQRQAALPTTPLLSVLMPTWRPDLALFKAAVASVQGQLYPHWQLCIADDASDNAELDALLAALQVDDARIRVVRRPQNGHICEASNSALGLADGPWVLLLDHDDVLARHALLLVAEAINAFPDAGLIYSDEDKLGPDGQRENPTFKPDWNHDLCLAQNMVCHLAAIRSDLMRRIGGLRRGFEGAQDHDLVLRLAEQLQPRQIVHIPHVLYHWRMHAGSTAAGADVKPYAQEAGRRAVQEHLQRSGSTATVTSVGSGRYRVHWPLPAALPLVSILIPTRNQLGLLRQCISTLDRLTDYPNRELIIIDNGSDEADALTYLQALEARHDVRVLRDPSPFNYSALNNLAACHARGELLVLLNNDIEVIASHWLREMVSQALRPGVGAVGAKLLYPDHTIQHGGVILGTDRGDGYGGVAGPAQKGLARHAGGYVGRALLAQSFSAVTAACLVIQKSRFDEVGGFDAEHLAVAYNDVDLCLRLREAGYTNVWTPYAELIHHESISRGRDISGKNLERFLRERGWMLQRWGDGLRFDPAYNINLNGAMGDAFSWAEPPRHEWAVPWFASPGRTAFGATATALLPLKPAAGPP